jgi:histidine triad (HIT) family protein
MARVMDAPCVFCGIVAGRLPAEVVDSDATTLAIMTLAPVNPGHVLVMPRVHVTDWWSLDESLVAPLMGAAHAVARRIMTILEPDGMNLVVANGEAAGQSVFHLHVHLIPRHHGDGVRDPWIETPGDPAEIAAVAQKLRIH